MQSFSQGPTDILNYSVNFTAWLNNDTITDRIWNVGTMTLVNSENNGGLGIETAFISGGSIGERNIISVTITTVGGCEKTQSFILAIQQD